jgi:hypothetical protein
MSRHRIWLAIAGLVVAGFTMSAVAGFHLPNLTPYQDPSGIFRTLSLRPIDLSNAFFDKLGTKDRSCGELP